MKREKNIQQLFIPYIVKRKNGQCQVLIPLIELDDLCDKIREYIVADELAKEIEQIRTEDSIEKESGFREDASWGERLGFGLRAIEKSRTVFAYKFEKPPYRR